VEDPRPFKEVYMPNHPDADAKGQVAFPNVEPLEEMVNMMDAINSYEANITAFNTSKDMIKKALEIGS
jgi:flagellar basal-body rod protein FlgC